MRALFLLASFALFTVTAPLTANSQQDEGILEKINLHGFLDARAGIRTQDDPNEKDASLGETRLQTDLQHINDLLTIQLRTDFVYDDIPEENDLDIEDGTGFIDIREANVLLPTDIADIKAGRQILTWGTGDMLFINDLFPKDWQSFFSGRDEEYLKAPSDAMFVSFFPAFANIDIAYTPRFDSDHYISGDRISYWNPMLGSAAGENAVIDPDDQDEWLDDDEIALRVSKNLAGYEAAIYFYDGFWKSPEGMDSSTMNAYFPELTVYGASLRGGIGSGLASLEAGYYDSKEDSDGSDALVPNSETRLLAGYERELMKNLSAGIQYYIEHMQDYSNYESSVSDPETAADENRQVATLRLTKQAMNQNLILSLFIYYSPTDKDAYMRPVVKYKVNDAWLVTAGGNVFLGEEDYTFFGQFADNSNVYVGTRYSF